MARELLIEKFKPDYVNDVGNAHWYNKKGEIHRNGDSPAIVFFGGRMDWYKDGKRHRDNDLPAVIFPNGYMWYKNGALHRDGGKPAVIRTNGHMFWYENGNFIKEQKAEKK